MRPPLLIKGICEGMRRAKYKKNTIPTDNGLEDTFLVHKSINNYTENGSKGLTCCMFVFVIKSRVTLSK